MADWAERTRSIARRWVMVMSHASGLPARAEDLGVGYDDDLLFWALRNSHLLREWISIADLADLLGVWSDETAWSIVADAAKAGMKE